MGGDFAMRHADGRVQPAGGVALGRSGQRPPTHLNIGGDVEIRRVGNLVHGDLLLNSDRRSGAWWLVVRNAGAVAPRDRSLRRHDPDHVHKPRRSLETGTDGTLRVTAVPETNPAGQIGRAHV